jgi:ubiquinone/menaquinone biosynthesis C-methylase UbiE
VSADGQVERALLDGARLEAGEDVLVLGEGPLVFGAHERVGDGWVYVVRTQVDELEELLAEAHAAGAAGVAYLVGEAPVLPLPDAAVSAVLGRLATDEGALEPAARELARVLRVPGRVALAEEDAAGGDLLAEALAAVGFDDAAALSVADGVVVTARRG